MAYDYVIDKWIGFPKSSSHYLYNIILPSTCPRCHHAIAPQVLNITALKDDVVTISLLCNSCNKVFLTDYRTKYRTENTLTCMGILNSYPLSFIPKEFDQSIQEVSPTFVTIFNQARSAESIELDQISGVGFRKSLEFLVKDYAISFESDNKGYVEQIKSMSLVQCIENHISHPRIKAITKRAAWLGNDETHYVKKYTAEDIETLKSLIKLSCNWITMDLDSKELENRIVHPSQL